MVATYGGQVGGVASVPGDGTNRGLSANLWKNKKGQYGFNPDEGISIFEDFENFDVLTEDVAVTTGRVSKNGIYRTVTDTGCTVLQLATEPYGVVRLLQDGTDNDECTLVYGGATTVLGEISDAAAEKALTIFECRVRASSIANTVTGIFVGLIEAGRGDAADEIIEDTGVMDTAADLIGFFRPEADGDDWDTVHQKGSGAFQTTGANVINEAKGASMVADTWYKLGLRFDPYDQDSSDAGILRFFVDGIQLADTVATPFATTFPDSVMMNFVIHTKNAAATANNIDIDWWAFHQSNVE